MKHKLIIADEAHKIRKQSSGINQQFSKLKTEKLWLLSGTPYEQSDNDLKVSEFGGFTQIGTPIKGFQQLIEEVNWHRQTDVWDMRAEDSASIKDTGAVELNMFK